MVWKIVGSLECGRRDMFLELSIRVQNILLPPHFLAPKTLAVSHTHVICTITAIHHSSATKLSYEKSFSSPGLN